MWMQVAHGLYGHRIVELPHIFPDDHPLLMAMILTRCRCLLLNIMWRDEMFLRIRPCWTSTILGSGHRIILMISENVWAEMVGDIVVESYPLPGRLTAQQYRNILEMVLQGLLEGMPLWGRVCVQSSGTQCEIRPTLVERDLSRKVNWTFAWPLSRHRLNGRAYAFPPWTTKIA
jgi:hypothetical protein